MRVRWGRVMMAVDMWETMRENHREQTQREDSHMEKMRTLINKNEIR